MMGCITPTDLMEAASSFSAAVSNDEVRVWYGGGDVARPDERIDGEIGTFTLRAEAAR